MAGKTRSTDQDFARLAGAILVASASLSDFAGYRRKPSETPTKPKQSCAKQTKRQKAAAARKANAKRKAAR